MYVCPLPMRFGLLLLFLFILSFLPLLSYFFGMYFPSIFLYHFPNSFSLLFFPHPCYSSCLPSFPSSLLVSSSTLSSILCVFFFLSYLLDQFLTPPPSSSSSSSSSYLSASLLPAPVLLPLALLPFIPSFSSVMCFLLSRAVVMSALLSDLAQFSLLSHFLHLPFLFLFSVLFSLSKYFRSTPE